MKKDRAKELTAAVTNLTTWVNQDRDWIRAEFDLRMDELTRQMIELSNEYKKLSHNFDFYASEYRRLKPRLDRADKVIGLMIAKPLTQARRRKLAEDYFGED